ncbi:PleD family two-component system response regulator [Elusimicrobiota bacterium]
MSKRRILIIDDERHYRDSVRLLLSVYEELEIIEAVEGTEGVEMAKVLKPDLVILDNKMPKTPGELTAKLFRSDPLLRTIPIIMMTGMRLSESEASLIKLDVDEYVLKPCHPDQLVSIIEKYIGPLKQRG